jgi:hypothetical protein
MECKRDLCLTDGLQYAKLLCHYGGKIVVRGCEVGMDFCEDFSMKVYKKQPKKRFGQDKVMRSDRDKGDKIAGISR